MEKLRSLLSDAQAAFGRLTDRERRMVGLAGLALGGFVVFLVLMSFSSTASGIRSRTEKKLENLERARAYAASFQEAERARREIEARLVPIQLMSYIEEKGTAAGLEVPKMDPKQDTALGDGKIIEAVVEVTLTDITLGKLVAFLNSLEAGQGIVKVKYLRIEPKVANENLTAWVTVAAYRLKQ